VLEHEAQVMSDAQLQEQIAAQPPATQEEILRINEQARPQALQVAFAPLAPRLADGSRPFLPDDAPPRSSALKGRRSSGARLTSDRRTSLRPTRQVPSFGLAAIACVDADVTCHELLTHSDEFAR
jgi:hypothetical protein